MDKNTTATYSINVTDSDSPPAWMDQCATATPGAQDSGRQRWIVTTEQPEALEAALDEDDSVLEYEQVLPVVHLGISVGTPSEHYPADEQAINGALDYDVTLAIGDAEIEGGITLWRDRDGSMGTCGSPLEGWCGDELLKALRALPGGLDGRLAQATLSALAALREGEVRA